MFPFCFSFYIFEFIFCMSCSHVHQSNLCDVTKLAINAKPADILPDKIATLPVIPNDWQMANRLPFTCRWMIARLQQTILIEHQTFQIQTLQENSRQPFHLLKQLQQLYLVFSICFRRKVRFIGFWTAIQHQFEYK